MLTVDNELKPGNSYAVAGNWQQAFDTWKSAAIKEKDRGKEAARQYNLGLAHEALAAEAMRNEKLEEANSHLNEAEKCYSQALSLDPGEKYFREILTRLQHDRGILKQEQEHQFMKEAVAMTAAVPVNAAPALPLTATIPLEGWPEGESDVVHDFRLYVRNKVAAQKEDPNEAFRQKLVSSAADYGVKEGVALQVVDSEVGRFLVLKQNVSKYLDDFKDAAADGVITAEERIMLKKRQKILHLSDAQVKEVERQFQIKEST
jgi:tetratricopeptide (TPR) repeat protein